MSDKVVSATKIVFISRDSGADCLNISTHLQEMPFELVSEILQLRHFHALKWLRRYHFLFLQFANALDGFAEFFKSFSRSRQRARWLARGGYRLDALIAIMRADAADAADTATTQAGCDVMHINTSHPTVIVNHHTVKACHISLPSFRDQLRVVVCSYVEQFSVLIGVVFHRAEYPCRLRAARYGVGRCGDRRN